MIRKNIRLITVIIAFILAITSVCKYLYEFRKTIDDINIYSSEKYQYTFMICEFPTVKDDSVRVYGKILDTNHPSDIIGYKVLFDINIVNYDILKYGYTVKINGCIKSASSSANDGNFDYKNYLMSKNTIGICYVDEKENAVFIKPDKGISSIMYKLHNNVSFYVDEYFEGDNNGLIKAMLTGSRENISESLKQSYQKAGIYHIVAVSGLHAGIFISVFTYLISILSVSKRKKSLLIKLSAIAVSILLLMFTGYGISVIRVILMSLITAICFSANRQYNIIISIITAAFIVIIFAPYYLFSNSFQLSFVSTLGLCIALKIRNKYKKNDKLEYLKSSVTISVGSSVATSPLSVYFFGMISLVGVILNIVVIPLATALLISSVIFFTLSTFLPPHIMHFLSATPDLLAGIINTLAKAVSSFKFSYIYINFQSFISIILLVFIVVLTYLTIRKKKYFITIIFVLVSLFAYSSLNVLTTNKMKITFLNCINGESTIVTTKNDKHIMFDCGSDSFENPGEDLFKSYLRYKGIDKIDCLYISYFDSSHTNSVNTLIKDGYIDSIIIPPKTHSNSKEVRLNREKVINTAQRYNIPISTINPGDLHKPDDNVTISVMGENLKSGNESSCAVYKITYNNISVVLSSSLAPTGQKKLNDTITPCTILKIPEQGKIAVTTKDYIERSNPQYAVITAGGTGKNDKPDDKLINYLKSNEIPTYRTDVNQTITFVTDGISITKIHTRKDK